ncbi:MAG: class I SAM-dependent methyltransferase [Saprospiraceae bacterium]
MLTFDKTDRTYLNGSAFSSIYPFRLKGQSEARTRIDFLKSYLPGKRVVHFGCVDHIPLIEHRRKTGKWVHEVLAQVCERVVGIDIVQAGIDYMTQNGFEAYNANAVTEEIPAAVKSQKWDYLVAGEVLEHIDDPVQFLKAIKAKYGPVTERIIITVPNAFSWSNFRASLRNEELINTDHRFWFTGYTLAKVATEAGIEVEGLEFCQDAMPSVFSLKYFLVRNKPNFRDRLVLIGKL